MRFRLGLVYFSILLIFSMITFRLVQLQVLKNPTLQKFAEKQFSRTQQGHSHRLPIVDRNGKELAVNMRAASVFAHPKLVRDKYRAATILAKHLGKSTAHWKAKLNSDRSFVWIQRQIEPETAKALTRYNLDGVFIKPENTRVYPNGSFASAVIGFTDIDGNGLAGIEFGQTKELTQAEPSYPVLRDGKGNATYIGQPDAAEEAESGVALTIDRTLQYMVEEELKKSLQETKAKSVMAILMDPFTGEILAMAQQPSFDPNDAGHYPSHLFVNRLVAHRFEPGSTLKALFAAEAVDRKILTPVSEVDGHNGKLIIGKKAFREHDPSHKFSKLKLEEVIAFSSNIGAIEVAKKLGNKGMVATLKKFGLTRKTEVGLPGEVAGSLRPAARWTPLVAANAAFGQGLAFTPLQMVTAFTPFANGGYLVKPKILRSEVTSVSKDNLDLVRVLSPETADKVRTMLVGVTEHPKGSGRGARLPGVLIAGKTGTAQKYEHERGYNGGKYYSSFIGFLPASHPQLLIGVMVDEPQGAYYGSQVAVPLFREIARRGLHLMGGTPRQLATARPLVNAVPTPVRGTPPVELKEKKAGQWEMPDLRGLTVRETLDLLNDKFRNVRVKGSGYVVHQYPKAGETVQASSRLNLEFSTPG
ncbi:MAG: transpeptidase family protein [Bdellovibrionales bacterium]|nr:transpeptidase family protein [Bdellovibrionales bacterium]